MRTSTYSMLAAAALAGAIACTAGEISYPVTRGEEFIATLSGANENPPVTTSGSGLAHLSVIDDTILTFNIAVTDMDSTILSHIHAGDGATNGPVIVNLFIANTVNCKQNADTALVIDSSRVGNPTTIKLIGAHRLTNPSTFLVRIAGHAGSTPSLNGEHSATVTGTTTFTVPVDVTVAGTGGTAQRFTLINVTSPRCRADFTGAIAQTQIRPGNLTLASIQGYGATPRARFDSLVSLMRSGNVYVNVHTRANTGGEVRGQIGPL